MRPSRQLWIPKRLRDQLSQSWSDPVYWPPADALGQGPALPFPRFGVHRPGAALLFMGIGVLVFPDAFLDGESR